MRVVLCKRFPNVGDTVVELAPWIAAHDREAHWTAGTVYGKVTRVDAQVAYVWVATEKPTWMINAQPAGREYIFDWRMKYGRRVLEI